MNDQLSFDELRFDLRVGSAAKETGMQQAASNRQEPLIGARETARWLAEGRDDRTITADDVQRVLLARGVHLGNAAGSIFRGGEWECVGWRQSTRISNHARMIRAWRLREG